MLKSLCLSVALLYLLSGITLAADSKSFSVEIKNVTATGLIAEIIIVRTSLIETKTHENASSKSKETVWKTTGQLVFLMPAGKCSAGDRFSIVATEKEKKPVKLPSGEYHTLVHYLVSSARAL